MQRWISVLAVVLVAQVLLAGGLLFRGDRLAPAHSDAPLVGADLKNADRLAIDGPAVPATQPADKAAQADARIELVKRNGAWLLPASADAPAEAKKVEAVLKQLAETKRGLPIATTAQALDRFKVGEHDYERRVVVSRGDKTLVTVYLGSAPGGRKANARTADDQVVYDVDLATYDLPTARADWLDKTLLQQDASLLTRIEIAEAGKAPIVLQRPAPAGAKDAAASDGGGDDAKHESKGAAGSAAKSDPKAAPAPAWSAEGLGAGERLDPAKADALAHAVAGLKVDDVLGTQPQPDWQQEPPRLRLTLTDASDKSVTWTIVKPKSGDTHVLKASDKPWYFELKSWDAQPLLDAAARDKLVQAGTASASPAGGQPRPPAKKT